MDKLYSFRRIVQKFHDDDLDPIFGVLLILGCVLFLAFMTMLLMGFDLFGLKDVMYPMSIWKSWAAAGILCLPAIVYGAISDFLNKRKEKKSAAN